MTDETKPAETTSNLNAAAQVIELLVCRVVEADGKVREAFSDKNGNLIFTRLLEKKSE